MTPGLYRAVIFDMDGVLADSEPLYFESINAVLRRHGGQISEDEHRSIMATGPREGVAAILQFAGVEADLSVDGFLDEFEGEILAALPRMTRPMAGAADLIEALRGRSVPVAVASSSKVSWIEATLGAIGLADRFDGVVSGTQVAHPKPAPDVYLRAAEVIGMPPANCIAIEDTPTGLRSVKAAGMFAIQVRSSSMAFPPQPEADVVIESLEEFDFGLLA